VLFNSLEFILFGLIFFAAWPLLRRRNNTRWTYLVIASFFFYGWWDWRFLFLITFSGLIDYGAALGMVRWPKRRTLLLVLSIVGNVGSLAVFKYLDFVIRNINALIEGVSWASGGAGVAAAPAAAIPLVNLALPVGLSFYTFQSMSYTIDVYRGHLQPTRNPLHFFAYLAMFPQLVAGPIVRAADLLPQLRHYKRSDEAARWDAIRLIVYGYFKKAVVADTVARFVEQAFTAEQLNSSCAYWWVIMTLFAFQIYCDFSGYSDIARGLARWMGYDFPMNFNHPYISRSFREFWGRWHISLSTWFRDYVYIPLGGSRGGRGRSEMNLWTTMLISGLWHGAQWTFVAWGAVHAALLSAERMTKWPQRLGRIPGGKHVAVLMVFAITLVTWVFFRADSFSQAAAVIATMFRFDRLEVHVVRELIHVKAAGVVALMMLRQVWVYAGLGNLVPARSRVAKCLQPVMVALLIAACVLLRGPGEAFIYFQF